MSEYERQVVRTNFLLLSAVFLSFLLIVDGGIKFIASSFTSPFESNMVLSSTVYSSYYLPFGGRQLVPEYRFVALYGTPNYPGLGVLGEQSIQSSIQRAKNLASKYQAYSEQTVIPTFDIITSVASASATADGNYSQEISATKLKPWIDAAKKAGVYVVLDLQPGRTSFLAQAKQYESLLKEPHVGLALDPEWRLKSNQLHLRQIGSVKSSEINTTSKWLADLVKNNNLPQKMLLIHQFQTTMIENRSSIDTSREELAFVIQMDGQGSQSSKDGTYRTITNNAPKNILFGWKNFYDEDSPSVRTPANTMQISPKPWFVSYQ